MTIGYDNKRTNQTLVMDLQFRETTGTVTQDWSKLYLASPTLTGAPAWTARGNDLTYLSFDPANPDYIQILAANCTDLNFTSGAFSGGMWIYPDAYGNRYLFDKSSAVAGWNFWVVGTSPYLGFGTLQAGPTTQYTYGGANLVLSTWQFVSFMRSGANARIYINGRDVTTTPATHVNPASSAAINLDIGVVNGAAAGWYDGRMWRPRVWTSALQAEVFLAIYEEERDLLGV